MRAQTRSNLLPNKVKKLFNIKTIMKFLFTSLSKAKSLDQILLSTSNDKKSLALVNHIKFLGYQCVEWSENNVHGRNVKMIKINKANIIVRVTEYCPLVNPTLIDNAVSKFLWAEIDYLNYIAPSLFLMAWMLKYF